MSSTVQGFRKQEASILSLPDDILQDIFQFLDDGDIDHGPESSDCFSLASCNTRLHSVYMSRFSELDLARTLKFCHQHYNRTSKQEQKDRSQFCRHSVFCAPVIISRLKRVGNYLQKLVLPIGVPCQTENAYFQSVLNVLNTCVTSCPQLKILRLRDVPGGSHNLSKSICHFPCLRELTLYAPSRALLMHLAVFMPDSVKQLTVTEVKRSEYSLLTKVIEEKATNMTTIAVLPSSLFEEGIAIRNQQARVFPAERMIRASYPVQKKYLLSSLCHHLLQRDSKYFRLSLSSNVSLASTCQSGLCDNSSLQCFWPSASNRYDFFNTSKAFPIFNLEIMLQGDDQLPIILKSIKDIMPINFVFYTAFCDGTLWNMISAPRPLPAIPVLEKKKENPSVVFSASLDGLLYHYTPGTLEKRIPLIHSLVIDSYTLAHQQFITRSDFQQVWKRLEWISRTVLRSLAVLTVDFDVYVHEERIQRVFPKFSGLIPGVLQYAKDVSVFDVNWGMLRFWLHKGLLKAVFDGLPKVCLIHVSGPSRFCDNVDESSSIMIFLELIPVLLEILSTRCYKLHTLAGHSSLSWYFFPNESSWINDDKSNPFPRIKKAFQLFERDRPFVDTSKLKKSIQRYKAPLRRFRTARNDSVQ